IVVCCGFRVRLDGHDDPTADRGIAAIQANLLRGGGRPETGHRLATPDMAPSHAHDARSASYSSEQNGPPRNRSLIASGGGFARSAIAWARKSSALPIGR